MRSYYKHIVLILLALTIVFSCKKDKVPSCPSTGASNCENIQNVKHFFYFKVGSWWVYEEETSGDLDTVYVTEAAENPSNYDFDVRVYSSYQDYYYHFWPEYSPGATCKETGQICGSCLTVKRSKYRPGVVVYQANCFWFIAEIGQSQFNYNSFLPNNKVFVQGIDTTYSNGILNFDRTFRMHELNTVMEGYQETNHYFSENVGLVRKELLDSNEVWNLIDYYIQP